MSRFFSAAGRKGFPLNPTPVDPASTGVAAETSLASAPNTAGAALRRDLGLPGAVLLGLGSILGTGVFVSIGIAAGIAGPAVLPAIALAGFVALCNALSSAQLAASHPVSGGTYEYGYRYLHPRLGFAAGWMFLCAKSASAATAALGLAAYLLSTLGLGATGRSALALGIVAVVTLLTLSGLKRSARVNAAIVCVTVAALGTFVVVCLVRPPLTVGSPFSGLWPAADDPAGYVHLLQATALMFVAYTGYGRIATLGEEVREPARTIPRAIVLTLAVSAALYLAVGFAALRAVGAPGLSAATQEAAAPLEVVARGFDIPGLPTWIAIGAMTAMFGVLLNLVLGLSRIVLAMGRRGDLPTRLAHLSGTGANPNRAVWLVAVVIAGLVAIGDVKTTWSFSAMTVLVYYALTNAAALRLPPADRRFPRLFAILGLFACLSLIGFIEPPIWLTGLGLLLVGLGWQYLAQAHARRHANAAAR